jgi:hypothetical protein
MEPLTAIEGDQLTGVFGTGGTALVVNTLHSLCNGELANKIFHKHRWYVKPLVLLIGTMLCGIGGAFASGLDARTALAACVMGLLSSVTGPAWKNIWAEAVREYEEEEAELAPKSTSAAPSGNPTPAGSASDSSPPAT